MQPSRRSRDSERLQRAEPGPCPGCGESLPAGSFWQRLKPPAGRRPAWRLTHPRANGAGWCTVYAGEAVTQEGGNDE